MFENYDEEFVDITSDLDESSLERFNANGMRLYEVSLDCLLVNSERLVRAVSKDYFMLEGIFNYFSPVNWSYDFSDPLSPVINLGEEDLPAQLTDINSSSLVFYVAEGLVQEMPNLALKGFDPGDLEKRKERIKPTLIYNPVFGINCDYKTRGLVSLVLVSAEHINIAEQYLPYQKFGNSD